MQDLDLRANDLLETYRSKIRPVLAELTVGAVKPTDRAAEVLEDAISLPRFLHVGFVGESQVGKSTLINAILGRRVLPSGGVGPLTARTTRVRFGEPAFQVTYHDAGHLNRLAFTVERALEKRGDIVPPPKPETEARPRVAADGDASPELSSTEEYSIGQLQRMFQGSSASDSTPLTAGAALLALRSTIGPKELDGASAPVAARVRELASFMGKKEDIRAASCSSERDFYRALSLRAADWLSPLVSRLDVQLPDPVLQDFDLVDLPGIGVAGDPAAQEAARFVEKEGDALVIVARNSGLTEKVASLLTQTRVITKLLFGGRPGVPPINVVLVVTHLDDVARDRFATQRTEARELGQALPDRYAVFESLSVDMKRTLRGQLREALRAEGRGLAADGSRRDQVLRELCESLPVITTAAPDHLQILEGQADEAFLRDTQATGIDALRAALTSLAGTARARRETAMASATQGLQDLIEAHLRGIIASFKEGSRSTRAGWERFRTELDRLAAPLKLELAALHADTLAILQKVIPEVIRGVVSEAGRVAEQTLEELRRDGTATHYMSLNAAVKRGGQWARRGIDYPDTLTQSFVDAIAAAWEPRVVEAARDALRKMVERDASLVAEICEGARSIDESMVPEARVTAMLGALRQGAEVAIVWTGERLEEFRASVRTQLFEVIALPLREECQRAVAEGKNRSAGAKVRILDSLETGAREAIKRAGSAAQQLADGEYQGLLARLHSGFIREHGDPITELDQTWALHARLDTDETQRKRMREMVAVAGDLLRDVDAARGIPA